MIDLEPVKEVQKSYGGVIAMMSSVATGGLATISLFKLVLVPYFAASGPAIEFHDLKLVASFPGQPSLMQVKLSKKRPCKPSTIVLQITDSKDRVFVVDTSWTRPLLVRDNQEASFDWTVPRNITGGVAKAYLSATHGECSDGGRPPPPADINSSVTVYVE